MTHPQTIAVVVGTRPEAIKMGPLVLALKREQRFRPVLVSTAQHTDMLDQALDAFGLVPDIDLGLTRIGSSIEAFLGSALEPLGRVFAQMKPTLTMVQGDTMSVLAAAQASFFERFPVAHVEAGLRSDDLNHPFPEEATRRLVSVLVSYHFAPTERARQNLLREGVDDSRIWVTGNTVVDALRMLRIDKPENESVAKLDFEKSRVILVTAHRRENHGEPLHHICDAIAQLVRRYPDVEILFPVHANPDVHNAVHGWLGHVDRVHLTPPLSYGDLLYALRRAELALTDSGGIQEEAPSFHCPVLIMRDVTERPEVVEVGAGKIVGTDADRIVSEVSSLLDDDAAYEAMATAPNPFGDGHAAERIVEIVGESFERRRIFRAV
ncbi:MAG TPA: UDP-N-acetylglucosamine 2-epimerase (non-hydrolyzing) [Gemmatimonadaceae bacterium]